MWKEGSITDDYMKEPILLLFDISKTGFLMEDFCHDDAKGLT
jgi:hypothetical protein